MSGEILGVSAVIILAGLLIISWLTDSKAFKLVTVLFVLLYPVIIGQVEFPDSPDSIVNYLEEVVKYWISQVWEQVWNFIQQQLNPIGG